MPENQPIIDTAFIKGIGRAFAGAVLFALPLLMTMEMWWLGFYMDNVKLLLFLATNFLLLVGLAYHAGYRQALGLRNYIVDALVAAGVGIVTALVLLTLLGVTTTEISLKSLVGMTALESVPCSIGAILARSILGGKKAELREGEEETRYFGELFLMYAGAVFFAFNVAPTEEMILITYKMNGWLTLGLALFSLVLMHIFVYRVEFIGQAESESGLDAFFRFSVAGYALSLLTSTYILWIFGRFDGLSLIEAVRAAVVLGFPASLGAATARIVL
jgi:putative integral membrane protein (TIGR02587 family)